MNNQLNYRGDCRAFDPNHILGPDQFDGNYVATAATYDADRDITTMTLRPLPPAELAERAAKLTDQATHRTHLRLLFGTFPAMAS